MAKAVVCTDVAPFGWLEISDAATGVEADRPALGGNENVPAGYRDMVNEYFKSLSKKPGTTPPATPKKPGSPQ